MLKIRLSRTGKKRQPSFRVVVQEHTSPIKGKFIENIGNYLPATKEKAFTIDTERVKYWLSVGARPSDTVAVLLKKNGIEGMEEFIAPRDKQKKKKKQEESKEEAPKTEDSAEDAKKEEPKTEDSVEAPAEAPGSETSESKEETSDSAEDAKQEEPKTEDSAEAPAEAPGSAEAEAEAKDSKGEAAPAPEAEPPKEDAKKEPPKTEE